MSEFERLQAEYDALVDKANVNIPVVEDAQAIWVDLHISAQMPIDPRLPEHRVKYSPLFEASESFISDLVYFEGIRNGMVHKHSGNHLVNGCLDKNGVCKSGYSTTCTRPHTTFTDKGFPQYRRGDGDLFVVPHNRLLFEDWGHGHANVEFSGGTYTCLYLYKYLFKGPSKVSINMREQGSDPTRRQIMELHKNDEIGRYIRGRRLCSMDAMWRLLGFHTYPASDPPVVSIKVRSPGFLEDYKVKKLLCDLHVYFARPVELRPLLFEAMFTEYIIYRAEPSAVWKGKHVTDPCAYFHIQSLDGVFGAKPVYIQKRDVTKLALCRLATVSHSSGELWWMRMLLKLFAFDTLLDMYKLGDVTHDTFHQAAIARGVANDLSECLACYQNSVLDGDRSPRELRTLFVTLAVNGFPVRVIYDDELLRPTMYEPQWVNRHDLDNDVNAIQRLLSELRDRIAEHSKTMADLGLPEPQAEATELERSLLRYPIREQAALFQHFTTTKSLTVEQQTVFDSIMEAILVQSKDSRGTFITLEGSGGTGKTEVAKHLMACIRMTPVAGTQEARSVHAVCSTALGAQNYPKGQCSTAHSFFMLPVEQDFDKDVDDDKPMESRVVTNPERFELISHADVIFWDEAMANHRECLEAVLAAFDDFKGTFLTITFSTLSNITFPSPVCLCQ